MDEMMPMIVCLSGTLKGCTFSPYGTSITLGSDPAATVRFPPSAKRPVEPLHAELTKENGDWSIKSLAGTPLIVNEEETDACPLHQNDLVRLGPNGPLIRFRLTTRGAKTKSFKQLMLDSTHLSREEAGPSRRTLMRAAYLAKNLTSEAVHHGSWTVRLGLATLLIGILGLAGWLVIRQLDADERASKSEKMLENVQARSEQSDRERARLKGQIANEAAERKREMDRLRKEREALQSALGLLESQREDQTAELRALMARTDRVNSAVDRISSELEAAKRIHEQFARGVAVIAVGTTFHKKDDPKTVVRHRLDMTAPGTRKTSGITVGGDGPIYIEWVTGSGFLVDDKGTLITNRHVVQPWWKEPNFGNGLQSAGFVPKRTELFACFPGVRETVKLELITTGEGDDDVALVRAPALPKGLPILSLPASQSTPTAGDKVILLGYPEGVRGLVNKLDAEAVQSLEKVDVSDSGALVRAIANLDGIRATLTQGVLSDRTAEYLVYDAVSTHGGSGGPLFSADGVVIGINTAVSGGFAGHNYAVHLETGRKLLGQ